MDYRETPLCFDCEGHSLLGIMSVPEMPARVGVVIVVGGPQYRVGSHRQFVHLARMLAAAGFACLRFDYRGMGDSEGDRIDFESTGPDIAAAVGALIAHLRLDSIVLWGLCDGATACTFGGTHPRVVGMILFNPWVHTEAAASEATIKHYYARRWLDRAFWRKLRAGNVRIADSIRDLLGTVRRYARSRVRLAPNDGRTLPERVARGIANHNGPVLVVLSGNDQTAAEYQLLADRPGPLQNAMKCPSVTRIEVAKADHTFSTTQGRKDSATVTLDWLHKHFRGESEPASHVGAAKELQA